MYKSIALIISAIAFLFMSRFAYAADYRTPEQIAEELEQSGREFESINHETGSRTRPRSLDDIAYFLKYRQLCDFLVDLQFTGGGSEFGGMREGESGGDWTIIQTDNTEEAIRVWSQYGIWTGDTGRYSLNIARAWQYLAIWPAWQEEGGNFGYYRMHNCGWGFEAVAKYREAYGDTSHNNYADQCAQWVITNTLAFNENAANPVANLEACAQGLGVGGMYQHATYRNNTTWQNHCITQGRRLRTWFNSNPARLNACETWALCGGTALWGVCQTLFTLYPDSGQMWINQYGTQLETWSNNGSWYNAYNTWYSNATFRCFEITGDSLYWNRGVFYCDSLIGFDTDDDGGIPPGNCCTPANDHSWVSAYMGWMGMERIINSRPFVDFEGNGFYTPDPDLPYLAGDPLPVGVQVTNNSIETATGWIYVTGMNYSDSAEFDIGSGEVSTVEFENLWILPDDETLPDSSALTMIAVANIDTGIVRDTIVQMFDIRRGVDVYGVLIGEHDPFVGPPAIVEFYHEAYPDSIWTAVEVGEGTFYDNGDRKLLSGNNRIHVIPPERYIEFDTTVTLNQPQVPIPQIDITLSTTEILLVDDDSGENYETYVRSSLDSLGQRVRSWEHTSSITLDLSVVPFVVWITGDDDTTSLDVSEQLAIQLYLDEGGKLLLSGQNIIDNLAGNEFLENVLQCQAGNPDTDIRVAYGIGGMPIFGDAYVVMIGNQGANNQNSTASLIPNENATVLLTYADSIASPAAIASNYGFGQFVFMGFGIEAVSGINGSWQRDELIAAVVSWFDSTSSTPEVNPILPHAFYLSQNYPNPFNPSTTISFVAPIAPVTLTIYDLLGRRVAELYDGLGTGSLQTIDWKANVSSGTYYYVLRTQDQTASRAMHLIR